MQSPSVVLFHELIVEILSRLPVKSLARFKCVCKSWKSIISDPQFVTLHLHRSASNADFAHLRLIFERTFGDLDQGIDQSYAVSYSLHALLDNLSYTHAEEDLCYRLQGTYKVVGSCNGLICLVGVGFEECWVRLLNLATGLTSQKSPSCYHNWGQYQSAKSGFGYDHLSDSYKVVIVLYNCSAKEDSQITVVKIYSMGDNCWRNIPSFPAIPTLRHNHGIYLSSTLNWLAVSNFSSGYKCDTVTNDRFVIVSLDLGKETCKQLSLPHIPDEVPHFEPALQILGDSLCVYHDYKGTHFVVWQMKEFGVEESWTQLVNISYMYLQIRPLEFDNTLIPLCMSKDGNVVIVPEFTGSQVILYNCRDNRLKRCQIPDNIQWIKAKLYIESLVSPCSTVT